MSDYVCLECHTCKVNTSRYWNHGFETMQRLIDSMPQIKVFLDSPIMKDDWVLDRVWVHQYYDADTDPITWLIEHDGHDIAAVSEYNRNKEYSRGASDDIP